MSRAAIARAVAVVVIVVGSAVALTPTEAKAAGGHCRFSKCGFTTSGFYTCVFSATTNCTFVGGQCQMEDCFPT
jgi:hypothetical protein